MENSEVVKPVSVSEKKIALSKAAITSIILGGIIIGALVATVIVLITTRNSNSNNTSSVVTSTTPGTTTVTTTSITSPVPSTTTLVPTTTATPVVFQNGRMSITIPTGWNYKSFDAVYLDPTSQTDKKVKDGGLVLTKGNYTINVIPYYIQASGVNGGRFGDIAGLLYAPETKIDSANCILNPETNDTTIGTIQARNDLYYYPVQGLDPVSCGSPQQNYAKGIWYGSYVNTKGAGYFSDYFKVSGQSGEPANGEMAITMSYYSKTPNNFPLKSDTQLQSMLTEMSGIVSSVKYLK